MNITSKKHTVLFFVRRVGPYHHVRFEAAAQWMDLVVIETRAVSQEYAWEFTAGGTYKLERFNTSDETQELGIRGTVLTETIAALFDKYQPTAVVTTGWADPEYHAVILQASVYNTPLITVSDSRYEDEPRSFSKELIKRLILRPYRAVIVAGTSARSYAKRLGMPSEAIFHPWDVVDNDYFRNNVVQRSSFDSRSFLCISRLIEKKNLPLLIAAFADYRKNGGKRSLTILGNGELETSLKQLVAELHIGDSVTFHGFVQYNALPRFMSQSIGLILASTTDQWGLVVNEAMAAGLPVLVSNNCGCAVDIVKEGVNGFVFEPLNKTSITRSLEKLDRIDEQDWNKMSASSLDIISKWTTADFATALSNAVNYSQKKRSRISLLFLHRLLSKR